MRRSPLSVLPDRWPPHDARPDPSGTGISSWSPPNCHVGGASRACSPPVRVWRRPRWWLRSKRSDRYRRGRARTSQRVRRFGAVPSLLLSTWRAPSPRRREAGRHPCETRRHRRFVRRAVSQSPRRLPVCVMRSAEAAWVAEQAGGESMMEFRASTDAAIRSPMPSWLGGSEGRVFDPRAQPSPRSFRGSPSSTMPEGLPARRDSRWSCPAGRSGPV